MFTVTGTNVAVVDLSVQCLNIAFDTAYEDATSNGKVFSAQNWSKSKASLKDTRGQIKQYLLSMRMMSGEKMFWKNRQNLFKCPKKHLKADGVRINAFL